MYNERKYFVRLKRLSRLPYHRFFPLTPTSLYIESNINLSSHYAKGTPIIEILDAYYNNSSRNT